MSDTHTICDATIACREQLEVCTSLPHLTKDDWAKRCLADFNLWASGLGASARADISLDRRLDGNPRLRDTVRDLLEVLEFTVQECQQESTEDDPEAYAKDDLGQSDEESAAHPFADMMDAVEELINQLARLSMAIRKSGSRARLERADRFFQIERHEELQHELTVLTLAMTTSPETRRKGLYSQLPRRQANTIQARLIESNLRRRHRFLYAQKHAMKLSRERTDTTEDLRHKQNLHIAHIAHKPKQYAKRPQTGSELEPAQLQRQQRTTEPAPEPSGTTPTAVEDQVKMPQGSGSQPSMTMASSTTSKLDYPNPPLIPNGQKMFKCPCCCQSLSVFFSKGSRWRKHIKEDILPYTCVLENCPQEWQFYATTEDWLAHVQNDHSNSQYWQCFSCKKPIKFEEQKAFRDHIRVQHRETVSEDQLEMLVSVSAKSAPADLYSCPLCPQGDTQIEPRALLDHIAEHVHRFSLYSLPWPIPGEREREYFKPPGYDDHNKESYFDLGENLYFNIELEDEISGNAQDSFSNDASLKELSVLDFETDEPDVRSDKGPATERSEQEIAEFNGGLKKVPQYQKSSRVAHWLEPEETHLESNLAIDNLFREGYTGIRVLHDAENAVVDVILIHGFTGNSIDTWRHRNGAYWPIDFLLQADIPPARIMTFGYNFYSSRMTPKDIEDPAIALNRDLCVMRAGDNSEARKIVIVVHSLGGLVLERAIAISETATGRDEKQLNECIFAIAFLGTPQFDLSTTNSLKAIVGILSLVGKGKDMLTEELEGLRETSEWFSFWLSCNKEIQIACFYETSPLQWAAGRVVSPQYAIIPGAPNYSLTAKHTDMTKFSGRFEKGYQRIERILIKWLVDAHTTRDLSLGRQARTQEQIATLNSLWFLGMNTKGNYTDSASPNTCSWILENNHYKTWSSKGGILWITGRPGSGKSIMMRYLVNALEQSPSEKDISHASFFFHLSGRSTGIRLLEFFRALLFQLSLKNRFLLERLTEVYSKKLKAHSETGVSCAWSIAELQDLFMNHVTSLQSSSRLWVLVDALDKADEQKAAKLVNYFDHLVLSLESTRSSPKLLVCLSSRVSPDITLDSALTISMEDNNTEDISALVKADLSPQFKKDEVKVIEEFVMAKSEGIFVSARCMVEQFNTLSRAGISWHTIKKCLDDEVPFSLESFYRVRLQELLASGMEETPFLGLIQWLCFAVEPLTLQAVKIALLLLDTKGKRENLSNLDGYIEDSDVRVLVQNISGGLAEIVALPDNDPEQSLEINLEKKSRAQSQVIVKFRHKTVKEWMITDGLGLLGSAAGPSHHSLCRSCLKFMSFPEYVAKLDGGLSKTGPNDVEPSRLEVLGSFGSYATKYWYVHGVAADDEGIDQSDLVSLFCSTVYEKVIATWWRIYGSKALTQQGLDANLATYETTLLSHVFAACGLATALEAGMKGKHFSWFDTDREDRTVLHWAVSGGNDVVIQLALDSSDPNVGNSDGNTPLHYAVRSPMARNLVELFLEREFVDFNYRNYNGETPLLMAVVNRSRVVVELLLSRLDVDIHLKTWKGRTPLHYAAESGNLGIIRILVGAGARVDARDEDGLKAVDLAKRRGNSIVEAWLYKFAT